MTFESLAGESPDVLAHESGGGSGQVLRGGGALRDYDYHPRSLVLTPTGVRDFFLPDFEKNTDEFCEVFCRRAAGLLRDAGIDGDRTAEAAWLGAIYMALDATICFNMTQVAQACAKRGLLPSMGPEPSKSVLGSIARGNPPPSLQVRILRSLRRRPSAARDWARWMTSSFRSAAYSRRPPALMSRTRDILCFSMTPGQAELAQQEGKRLVLSVFDHWFENLPDDAGLPVLPRPELVADLADMAASMFSERGVSMPEHVRTSLTQSFTIITQIALFSLQTVERQARRLPREFWAGSLGSLNKRTIARVIQKEGGRVVGHDHGIGSGSLLTPLRMMIDWDFCDTFLTFSQAHVDGIKLQVDPQYKVRLEPYSAGVSPTPLFFPPAAGRADGDKAGRLRVCYVPSHYNLEYHYVTPIPFDIATLDFQIRLLTHLKSAGYEVVYKPHPHCYVGVVDELVRITGARLETRPFEQIPLDEIGVAIVGNAQSTVIRSALHMGVPMVILDTGRLSLVPKAQELLLRRAEIVALRQDEDNRFELNTGVLDAAIERSKTLRDDAFGNAYYPVV
jgi:hypothetical protein